MAREELKLQVTQTLGTQETAFLGRRNEPALSEQALKRGGGGTEKIPIAVVLLLALEQVAQTTIA